MLTLLFNLSLFYGSYLTKSLVSIVLSIVIFLTNSSCAVFLMKSFFTTLLSIPKSTETDFNLSIYKSSTTFQLAKSTILASFYVSMPVTQNLLHA